MRQPDWEALADLQFLLYNRIADSLNAALSGIALSDMPEAQDRPPGFWKQRATTKIANVLNLFTAWSHLVRYKMGEPIPERVRRPFPVNALLAWLGDQLQLSPPPQLISNPLVYANQQTLQEALLLLYSAAYTQGSSVRLEVESLPDGIWFRVLFTRAHPLPATFDALLESFGDHWRARDTLFELITARDFARLNGCEITLTAADRQAAFAFFVARAGASRLIGEWAVVSASAPPTIIAPRSHTTPVAGSANKAALDTVPAAGATQEGESRPDDSSPDGTPPQRVQAADSGATPVIDAAELAEAIAQSNPLSGHMPLMWFPPMPAPSLSPIGTPTEPPTGTPTEPPAEPPAERAQMAGGINTPAIPDARESDAPLNPAESGQPPQSAESDQAVPGESGESHDPVIVPARIPRPQLPERLRKPPAATSNVALTKDTQTMRPVRPADKDQS